MKNKECEGCRNFKSMCFDFVTDKIDRCPCKECLVKGLCHDYCDRYMLLYCEGFSNKETDALYKWIKDGFHFA